jgi:hypothetical protein
MKTQNGASKTTCEINDKNRIEEQFLFSQAFHRIHSGCVQIITTEVQFEIGNLKLSEPGNTDDTNQSTKNTS